MDKLRDLREKFFQVNNEYMNGHAAVCGIYATGVYFEICRHASKDQSSFPSIKHIAEKLGISRPSVIDAIKTLEENNIIKKEKSEGRNTVYFLIDKSEWIPVNHIDQLTTSTSQPRLLHQSTTFTTPVNHVYPKNTNITILSKNTIMSSKLDTDQLTTNISNKNTLLREEAIKIINFLNEKTGRKYQPRGVNLDFVIARLKEGYEPRQIRGVVAKKCREWLPDEKMAQYLRPATLFNRTKFAQYIGEIGANHVDMSGMRREANS